MQSNRLPGLIGYNREMARGWESKSVEDQINAREADASKTAKAIPTAQQRELQSRRAGLLLMRTRTLTALQSTRNETYRKQQEIALTHLDSELSAIELELNRSR